MLQGEMTALTHSAAMELESQYFYQAWDSRAAQRTGSGWVQNSLRPRFLDSRFKMHDDGSGVGLHEWLA